MFERFRRRERVRRVLGDDDGDGAVGASVAGDDVGGVRPDGRRDAAARDREAAVADERGRTQTRERRASLRAREPGAGRDGTTANGGAVEDRRFVRDGAGATDAGEHRRSPLVAGDTMAAVHERQRARFGGFSWGSDFFGFLCAVGLASILTGILAATGVALNLFDDATGSDASSGAAKSIGLGGAIALLIVLAIAWYAGGYVAGRMARFDGARQGVGVWLWTLLAAAIVAVLGVIGGEQYDLFGRLNLPSFPVGSNTLTGAGAIAGALALLVTLLSAMLGGRVGERFHRKVDRVALHDDD